MRRVIGGGPPLDGARTSQRRGRRRPGRDSCHCSVETGAALRPYRRAVLASRLLLLTHRLYNWVHHGCCSPELHAACSAGRLVTKVEQRTGTLSAIADGKRPLEAKNGGAALSE
jgi:hypothetical protein